MSPHGLRGSPYLPEKLNLYTKLSSSGPDPVQMTTRSLQTQPLSQVTRSGPRADSIIAIYHHHHHQKTFWSENRLKSLHEVDYKYSEKFQKGLEVTKSNEL